MDGLDYRVKKVNEFYNKLKSNGGLSDTRIDFLVKETCTNIWSYEVSNELFDSTLYFLNENLEMIMREYLDKIKETVESASKTLELVVDKNPKGANVLSFTNLAKMTYNKVIEEITRSKKIVTLDLNKKE